MNSSGTKKKESPNVLVVRARTTKVYPTPTLAGLKHTICACVHEAEGQFIVKDSAPFDMRTEPGEAPKLEPEIVIKSPPAVLPVCGCTPVIDGAW